jgi:hypothetical protein
MPSYMHIIPLHTQSFRLSDYGTGILQRVFNQIGIDKNITQEKQIYSNTL